MGSLGTLLRLLREGRRAELRRALERGTLPAALWRVNALVFVRLREPRPMPRPLDGAVVRWAGPQDEPLMQAIRPRRGGYAHHFSAGAWGLIATIDGEPAAFGWFETGERHRSRANGYDFMLGPGAAWAFGIEVEPAFRLSGIFHKYWLDGVQLARERGITRFFGAIQSDNPRSIDSHRRLGFELLCELRVARRLFVTRHRVSALGESGYPQGGGFGRWIGGDATD